jgi:GT2 family glycosyltransferase
MAISGRPPRGEGDSRSAEPRASIITVNTNELHRLEKYLPSVAASRGNFEIIISDNGSRDGSREYLAARYPAVRVVSNGKNIGFCAANNRAADAARGEFLVFLNPDTMVDPDWLVRLLDPFSDPSVGMTTAKILLMEDPDRINTCGNDVHLSGLTLCRGMGRDKDAFSAPEEVAAVSGAAFAVRAELFRRLGGFDDDFFIYMDETDLSCRARLAGWRCLTAPQSLVRHDYSLRFGSEKVFLQERNRYQMLLKNFRWLTIAVLLPALVLAEAITWGFILCFERAHAEKKWKAYAETAGRWGEIMRKRRVVQALRSRPDRDLLKCMGWKLDFSQVAQGPIPRAAAIVVNPLFLFLRWIVLLLVWW